MKIVIIGGGKVGFTLAKELSTEGHSIVLVDHNAALLRQIQEELDISVVEGNGANVSIQQAAEVGISNLMIAATPSDEINFLCCIVARKLGCDSTIARVRNPEYDKQMAFLGEELGLSYAVNPDKNAAHEIFRLLQFPSFLKRDAFARGKVELVSFRLSSDSALAGCRLDSMGDIWKINGIICGVERDGQITIPSGHFQLMAGDIISVAADASELVTLISSLKIATQKIRKVLIIGGSRISVYLADYLISAKAKVTIIEENEERCEELSTRLPRATIVNGDGTLQSLLKDEGIAEADAVVTLMDVDEGNLIVSFFANSVGVPKTITKIARTEYSPVFNKLGVDTIVNPRLLTSNEILRFVRAVSSSDGEQIQTLYRIMDDKAEALEFIIPPSAPCVDKSLQELPIRENLLVAAIARKGTVIVPNGRSKLLSGDSVVVVTTASHSVRSLADVFKKGFYNNGAAAQKEAASAR